MVGVALQSGLPCHSTDLLSPRTSLSYGNKLIMLHLFCSRRAGVYPGERVGFSPERPLSGMLRKY